MTGPKKLLDVEDRLTTKMGAWFAGERVVYRGKDLFTELRDLSWMDLLFYGITGRFFSKEQIRLFEGLWALTVSYPDPRLWNNRVAALAGTARSTASLGVSAALAVSEAKIYGGQANVAAMEFLRRARRLVDEGADLKELVKRELRERRVLAGFGRPIVKTDERIAPTMRLAEELGLAGGPHVRLAFAIERILLEGRWRMHMNITGLAAALSADQGLSIREYACAVTLCFSAGIIPCFIDATNKAEGSFFPLRCTRIRYEGVPRRAWE